MLMGPLVASAPGAMASVPSSIATAGVLHLVLGNALIGLVEGLILARLFKLGVRKSVTLMMMANYLSAWVGCLMLPGAILWAEPMTLHTGWTGLWVLVTLAYAMTVLLEWPFVASALNGRPRWLLKSVAASLVIQTATFALLFGWYWMPSRAPLYRENEVVELSVMSFKDDVVVYYISDDDGDVYARSLTADEPKIVLDLDSTSKRDRLVIGSMPDGASGWELVALLHRRPRKGLTTVVVAQAVHGETAPSSYTFHDPAQYPGTGYPNGQVVQLGSATDSAWAFQFHSEPLDGFGGRNAESGQTVEVALATPYTLWHIRDAVHLPGDKILFQLKHDHICILDPEKKQVALLARGRGPVAVLVTAED